jgi:general stress protein 26
MNAIQDLAASEAVGKMRDIIDAAASTCLFATNLTSIPFHLCPMQAQDVENDGTLWFFSGADSVHNANIERDPRVQLTFCNGSKHEYLAVYGRAEITQDIHKVDELWTPAVKTWFPLGKDDPNLTLVSVHPEKVHYWDTKDGKLVAMGKMLIGAVTGKQLELGVEGDLRL